MTFQEKITELKKYYNGCKENPWSIFFTLKFDDVIKTLHEDGFEEASEMIRCADIYAYRAEEASVGMI